MAEDEIVALDGLRINGDLEKRLKLYRAGEKVSWAAFRHGRLVQGSLTFLENPCPPLELVALDEATAAQKESFKLWTGVELEVESPSKK